MASIRHSDGVLKLAQSSEAQRRRTLLKASTELFVAEPTHSRTEIAIFEELALQLVRITPEPDRMAVARMLARHPDAPPAILKLLLNDEPSVAAIVLTEAKNLPTVDLLALIATGSLEHAELLAARPNLPADVVEALLLRLPPPSLPKLLANHTVRLPPESITRLAELGLSHPEISRALARRHQDVDDAELIDLFLDLDGKGRRRVIHALEILALREFAARRPAPRIPVPPQEVVEALGRAALSRDTEGMATRLAGLLDVGEPLARRILADEGGEALAIALKAAGLPSPMAMRLILFSGTTDTRSYFEVKRLVELYETMSLRSASLMVSRWRGDRAPLPARAPRHLPMLDAGTPVRRSGEAATPRSGDATPMPRRENG